MTRIRTLCAVAALFALAPLAAHADMATDWLAANDIKDPPKIGYTGPVIDGKFGHPAPPVSIAVPIWQSALKRLSLITNGKLNFKEYGAGTLIGPRDGFKAVRTNIAEWATCYVSYEGRALALSKVWEQPFVSPSNPMAAARISQELAPKYFAPEFERQGVVWAGITGFLGTDIMSKKPIRKLEDLQGIKLLAQGFSPEAAKALGVALVNIPYPDIYTALQQGLVDAVAWVDAGFIPYKVYELAKYHTTIGISGGGITHCYNKEWFTGLHADLQKAFYTLHEPMVIAMAKVTQVDFGKTARDTYKEKGVELITLPPEELQRFRDRLQPALDAWAADLEKDRIPARQLLADIKTLIAKYNDMSSDELMKLAIENPVQGIK
jgi:TRAP-type transport system periplasmic protein